MLLKKNVRGRSGRVLVGMVLAAAIMAIICPVIWPEVRAETAPLSKVYGFRNMESKAGLEMLKQLGIQVTADAHSSTVVVLTSSDTEELTRAYSILSFCDSKEPVALKVFGQVPEAETAPFLDKIQTELKQMVPGTLLDPPAKGGQVKPVIVDIYKGQLIGLAQASEMDKIGQAWQKLRPKTAVKSESNDGQKVNAAAGVQAATKTTTEPNTVKTPSQPQPAVKSLPAEPNKPVMEVKPAASNNAAVEPNQTESIPDDVVSAMAQLLPSDANVVTEGETNDEAFKKIVDGLMKQAAEEEKQAAAAGQTNPEKTEQAKRVEEGTPKTADTAKNQAAVKEGAAGSKNQTEAFQSGVSTAKIDTAKDAGVKPDKTAKDPKADKKADDKIVSDDKKNKEPLISKDEEELELTITLPEKVEIKSLLELVGKQLGLNYMFDETQVRGEVMLKIHDGKIKVKDCYALLEAVLRYRGFVMTRRGNLVTIVPMAQANQFADPKLIRQDQSSEKGDVIVSSIFELKYINPDNARMILTSMGLTLQTLPPITVKETNTLIITDYAYRIEKIKEVLKVIDVPGTTKKYTHRELKYMQATDLIPRLQKLASQMQNLSIMVGTTPQSAVPTRVTVTQAQPGQPAVAIPQPQQISTQGSGEQTVYLDSDERTNRILMIGNEGQLKTVNDLIDSLDVKQHNLRTVKEYEIKNVDASEVINVLNELGLARVSVNKQGPQAATPTGRVAVPVQQVPGQPVVQPNLASGLSQGMGQQSGGDQPFISIRPNTNSLLVNATSEQHEDIQLVIEHIDVQQKDQRTIREYEIQNVDAMEIVQTLGDLAIISKQSVSSVTSSKGSMYSGSSGSPYGTSSSRTTSGVLNQPGMVQPGQEPQTAFSSLPTAEGGTVKELITTEPQISILESTNSLLIHATPRQHAAVSLVIAHVDRMLTQTNTPYVVYALENQKAEDMRGTLEDLISETQTRAAAAKSAASATPDPKMTTRESTTSASPTLPNLQNERIRVISDKESNSLIVYANKKNQQWISALIKELDQYRPQVLLDCTLVAINKLDEFDYDLSLITRSKGFPTGGTMTNLTAIESPFPGSDITEATVYKGAGQAFYADDNIQALLKLTDQKGYGRVLGRPSVLVKDNQEGVIKSENKQYVAKYSSVATTTESTTTNVSVDFTDYTTGITLTITPHIASEKLMQLEIELDRTDIDPSDTSNGIAKVEGKEYPKPLDTVSSNIKTWSLVPSGATIILGGIETINQTKGVNKVPILGDIPLIGLLFRGISQKDAQSKLYIFVKANIVKPGDELTGNSDIERISQKKRRAFEGDEARFQGLQALPSIKPDPIQPEKILEDDEYIQTLKEKPSDSEKASETVEIQ